MAFLRKSKFRHVFGKALKRDQCYDGLRVSKTSWETKFCYANPKFVAVMTETAGGGFLVLPLKQVGRVDINQPQVCGHTRPVLDMAWCPHDDNMIASGGEDCSVKVWQIPDEGLKEPMTEAIITLDGCHERRVTTVLWHPSASYVLLTAGSDNKVIMWNLVTGVAVSVFQMPDQLWSISFNEDGSRFACTCKDKKLRVVDSRTGQIYHEESHHEGSKPSQAAYVRNDQIVTTGFSRMSERQYALWDVKNGVLEKICGDELDASNGVMFIFTDNDTGMFYLAGKGDSVVRYYEVTDESPYIHYLTTYQSSSPQRGMGFLPKRGVNVGACEIARFYKLHNNGFCEVIPFTVPRKSELFQEDIYPDTPSEEAAITADEFFSGVNAKPKLTSMKEMYVKEGGHVKKEMNVRKSTLLENRASKIAASQSSNSTEASATTATSLPPGFDPVSLLDDMRKLKLIVKAHEKRISTLEQRLDSDDELYGGCVERTNKQTLCGLQCLSPPPPILLFNCNVFASIHFVFG